MKIAETFTEDVLKELDGALVAPDGTIKGGPTKKQVKKTKDELEDDDEQRYEKVKESVLGGQLAGDSALDMSKHLRQYGIKQILKQPNDKVTYFHLKSASQGKKVVAMLNKTFGIKAQIDNHMFSPTPTVKFDNDQMVESVNEAGLKLDYCDKCMQMTNHKDKKCQKCKKKNESINEALYNVGLPKEIEYEKVIGKVVSKLKGIDAYAKMTARGGKPPVTSSSNDILIKQYGTIDNTSKLKSILKKIDPNLDVSKLKHNFNASDSARSKHDQDHDIWKYNIPKKMDWHQAKKRGLLKIIPVKKMNHDVVMDLLDMMAPYTSKQHELADQVWTSLDSFMQHASDFIRGSNWKEFQASVKDKYPMLESVNEGAANLSDLRYQIPLSIEDKLGISPKAFKSIKKKGKDYTLYMSSYMSDDSMDKLLPYVNKALGTKLKRKESKKGMSGMIHIIGESVNEAKKKIKPGTEIHWPTNHKNKSLSGRSGYVEKIKGNNALMNMHDNNNDKAMWIPVPIKDLPINEAKKSPTDATIKPHMSQYSVSDDPYDVAEELGKEYGWTQAQIEKAEKLIRKKYIKESDDPFKPEYGTGEVIHDCPKHVEVEGIKGKVVGHTLNEQGDVKYIDIDFGTGKVYKNIRTDKVRVLEDQSHQHEIKEEPKVKTITKDQLAEIIKEEIKSLDEISGFPNMQKWWKEDPKDIMSFVYWLQKKTPPTGDKWDKAWKGVATHLNKKHKAPSGDFEKIMGESVNEGFKRLKEDFFRIPYKVADNELYQLARLIKDMNDRLHKGNDMDPKELDRAFKLLNTIKKSVKKFKSKEEVEGTIYEGTMKKFSLVKVKVGKHKGEEGRIMVYGGPRKHSVVSLDYGEYNFNPKDLELAESVNEANKGKVHRAAKKGSYPAVIVVIEKGKVIHQEPVSTPEVAPAVFNVLQKKYPNTLIHLEDNTGKRLYSESLNRSELKSIIKEEFLNILKEATGGEIFAQYKDTIRRMEADLLNRMEKGGVPEDLEQDVLAVLVRQLTKGSNKIKCR